MKGETSLYSISNPDPTKDSNPKKGTDPIINQHSTKKRLVANRSISDPLRKPTAKTKARKDGKKRAKHNLT